MTYRYIEEEATADVAFEARGKDLPEVFRCAADAVMNVMIENPNSIEPRDVRMVNLSGDALDLLLVEFLQQFIYHKDAEQLLLRVGELSVETRDGGWRLSSKLEGEPLEPLRHHQAADVKAVTLHELTLEQVPGGWRAHVVLDI